MQNKKKVFTKLVLTILASSLILSCSDNKKQEPKEKDFLPKTTPYGVWTENPKEKISRLLKPMKDIEGATDDQKDSDNFIVLRKNLGFITHDNRAFFIFNTQQMQQENNKDEWGGIVFGKFIDNHFDGNFYSFTKNISPESVKITTPIDNYELIHNKSRFRFIYKNLEYKGSVIPAQNVGFYDIFKIKPQRAKCKLHSQLQRDGIDIKTANLNFQQNKIQFSSEHICKINMTLTPIYRSAGDIVELDAKANLNSCAGQYSQLHGEYSGIGFSLDDEGIIDDKKLTVALLSGEKPILLDCVF